MSPTEAAAAGGDERPRFSVITVNYNGLGWTRRALDSVLRQGFPSIEVLVVDSGSQDGSVDEIEAWCKAHPEARPQFLRFQQNIGFASGCNRAFERSRGEFIYLLNNDAELQEGVLKRIDELARQHPKAGSFMCSMRWMDDPATINSAGILAFWDASAVDLRWNRPVSENPDGAVEILGPCGGAAAWRREVLERIGFLDEEFFMYSEDVDLAMRAQRAGYESLYIPDAVVLHKGGVSAAMRPRRDLMEIHYRNVLLTMARNFPPGARLRGLSMYLARGLTGLLRIGTDDPVARAKAIGYVLKHRRRLANERRAIRALGPDDRVVRWIHLTAGKDT